MPQKEKLLAVQDFLEKEMLMEKDTIEALPIQRIFFPRYGDGKILYVQFANPVARATITNRSSYLQPNEEYLSHTPTLIKYVPAELFKRFKALENYAFQLRNNPSNPLSTNVRYGKNDFELRVRPAKHNPEYNPDFKPDPWKYIEPTPLPDLPAVILDIES